MTLGVKKSAILFNVVGRWLCLSRLTCYGTLATLMLSFDIETEGLDPAVHDITVAAVCDRELNKRRCYNFMTHGQEAVDLFLCDLDEAEKLCAFNGARFDIPFIVTRFNVPAERYVPWYLKLFDYFEVGKLLFDSHFSLNKLLQTNGFSPKTGSGLQAIRWAQEREFDQLEEYCQDDADLTYDISIASEVLLPLSKSNVVGVERQCGDMDRLRFKGGQF